MIPSCGVCLGEPPPGTGYHPRCLRSLFGSTRLPAIDLDMAALQEIAISMAGHTSLSGVQKKVSLTLEKATLRYSTDTSRFILKPQTETYPALPQNEHLTMRLASLFGIAIPPCGLIQLKDGSTAYLIRRFDRLPDGRKLRVEDFCQLHEWPPKDKYRGTGEGCATMLRRYGSEPQADLLTLFRLFVFAWWVGNGDMHLKNVSLLTDTEGRHLLSPAYDLVATDIYPGLDNGLALKIDGRDRNFKRPVWLRFAQACGLPEKLAAGILAQPRKLHDKAVHLIARSWLPDGLKQRYELLLAGRACGFEAGTEPG